MQQIYNRNQVISIQIYLLRLFQRRFIIYFMTFQPWGSSLKGVPSSDEIPDYYSMSTRFYLVSALIQFVVILTFLYPIIFTFYRAFKNIGQPIYDDCEEISQSPDKQQNDQQMKPEEDVQADIRRQSQIQKENNVKQSFYPSAKEDMVDIENADDIVYTFEDNDSNVKKRQVKIEEKKQSAIQQNAQQSDDESQNPDAKEEESETQEIVQTQQEITVRTKLFKYEDIFFRFAPAIIIPILATNSLVCDFISVGGLLLGILLFVCFNMLQIFSTKHPVYKSIYLFAILASFAPFFINQYSFEK